MRPWLAEPQYVQCVSSLRDEARTPDCDKAWACVYAGGGLLMLCTLAASLMDAPTEARPKPSCSWRRALLMPQVNPGSPLYHCG